MAKLWYVLSCTQVFAALWTMAHPGSSVHGIFQARILEWVAISSSRGSSQPRDQTHVSFISCIAGGFFTAEPSGKPLNCGESESHSVVSDSLWLMNYKLRGILQARILEWVAFPFSRGSSQPPRSPALQADSLPADPQGKPKNTGVASLSLLQQIFLTQESNWGLLYCRWILYQLSYQGQFIKNVMY